MRKQEELDKIKSAIESIDLSIAGYQGLLKNEDNVNEFSNYEEQIRLLNGQKKGLESNFQQTCEREITLIKEEIQGRESLLKTLEKRGNNEEITEHKNKIASLQEEISEIQDALEQMGLTNVKTAEPKESEPEEIAEEESQEEYKSMETQVQEQKPEEIISQEEQAKPTKSEQNKGRIRGMFQTLVAKLKQVREARAKVNGELERRTPEQAPEEVAKEIESENATQQTESVPEPQSEQQPAETPKEKLTTKFRKLLGMYAKTSLNLAKVNAHVRARNLKEDVKNSKLVQGAKDVATITIDGVVATGEAIKSARGTLQKARKETVQSIVNAGKEKTDSLLGKLEDSIYTKQARMVELQSDLQQGYENESELEMA